MGYAKDTGRTGPTWTFNGNYCTGRASGCENHPTNQYELLVYVLGHVHGVRPDGGLLQRHRGVVTARRPALTASRARTIRCSFGRALNSAVECHLHTVEVEGSNPSAPTIAGRRPADPEMTPTPAAPPAHPHRSYRYYDLVMAAFVTVLLSANVIGAAKVAQIGGLHLRGRRPLLPDQLRLRRRPHRGVRLRAGAQGRVGGLRRARLRLVHELGDPRLPARPRLAAPGGLRDGVRRDAAHRARLARRLLLRRVLQLVRPREDEAPSRRAASSGAARSAPRSWARRWTRRSSTPLAFLGVVVDRPRRCGCMLVELPPQGALGGRR